MKIVLNITAFCLIILVFLCGCQTKHKDDYKHHKGLQKAGWKDDGFIDYIITEVIRTDTEHRIRDTYISISPSLKASYRIFENVLGSLKDNVISTNVYCNGSISRYKRDQLLNELVRIGILNIQTNALQSVKNIHGRATLTAKIHDERISLRFGLPSKNIVCADIDQELIKFGEDFVRRFSDDKSSILTKTDGDQHHAQIVALEQLLANPKKFHGKRITTKGFYRIEFENSSLSLNEENECINSVWIGTASTFADKNQLEMTNDGGWAIFTGVFLAGPAGHMGLWPGEIVRVTQSKTLGGP